MSLDTRGAQRTNLICCKTKNDLNVNYNIAFIHSNAQEIRFCSQNQWFNNQECGTWVGIRSPGCCINKICEEALDLRKPWGTFIAHFTDNNLWGSWLGCILQSLPSLRKSFSFTVAAASSNDLPSGKTKSGEGRGGRMFAPVAQQQQRHSPLTAQLLLAVPTNNNNNNNKPMTARVKDTWTSAVIGEFEHRILPTCHGAPRGCSRSRRDRRPAASCPSSSWCCCSTLLASRAALKVTPGRSERLALHTDFLILNIRCCRETLVRYIRHLRWEFKGKRMMWRKISNTSKRLLASHTWATVKPLHVCFKNVATGISRKNPRVLMLVALMYFFDK